MRKENNTHNAGEQRYFSIPEVLKRFGFGKTTLYRMMHAGEFPCPVRIGRSRVAFRASDIEAAEARFETVRYGK